MLGIQFLSTRSSASQITSPLSVVFLIESHYHSIAIVLRACLSCKHIFFERARCFKILGAILQEISWGHFLRVP